MEPQIINQEILLFTGSSFCNRQFCKRDDNDGSNSKHSSMEELEKACWDGILYEIFPELVGNSMHRMNNHICNTASGVNFLCITMSEMSMSIENQTSVDPYLFFPESFKAN